MKPSVTPHIRWRSARRRSSEKSAKQVRRETGTAVPSPMHQHFYRQPPSWLVKGVRVHYSPIIGETPDTMNCTVMAEPFLVAGHPDGRWVTIIDKHRGWVACEALTPVTT